MFHVVGFDFVVVDLGYHLVGLFVEKRFCGACDAFLAERAHFDKFNVELFKLFVKTVSHNITSQLSEASGYVVLSALILRVGEYLVGIGVFNYFAQQEERGLV